MTQKKENNISLLAGILFAVQTVYSIVIVLTISIYTLLTFIWLLLTIGFGIVAFSLITKRRDNFLCFGFAVLFVGYLLTAVLAGTGYYVMMPSAFTLIFTLIFLIVTLICTAEITDYLPKLKGVGKKIWFVPAILAGLCAILFGIPTFESYHIYTMDIVEFIDYFLITASILLAMRWVAYPDAVSRTSVETSDHPADEIYCEMFKHILLLIFTFGIWLFVWSYRVTQYTNGIPDEEDRDPTTTLLLNLFVPFYFIYWTYKTAQRIDKMAAEKGIQSDLSVLCLILSIFVVFIPSILMQDKLNKLVTFSGESAAQQPPKKPEKPTTKQPAAQIGIAEELRTYKELLDSGVLTQEEFDAKKNQLLNL